MTKKFDQGTMTGRELRDMNSVLEGANDPASVHALYWIAKRRENQALTFDEALDVSVTEAMAFLGLDNPLTQKK